LVERRDGHCLQLLQGTLLFLAVLTATFLASVPEKFLVALGHLPVLGFGVVPVFNHSTVTVRLVVLMVTSTSGDVGDFQDVSIQSDLQRRRLLDEILEQVDTPVEISPQLWVVCHFLGLNEVKR